jgi:hypothetical protein
MFQKNIVLFIYLLLGTTVAQSATELKLVPQPREIRVSNGRFTFVPNQTVIRLNPQAEAADRFSAQLLQAEIARDLKLQIPVGTEAGRFTIHLGMYAQDQIIQKLCKQRKIALDESIGREGYFLSITPNEILVTALTSRGLFYGVQTLRQIIRGNSVRQPSIPTLFIRDFPAFPIRGAQDDISRGPVPTLSFLKKEIERLAELKINFFTLYTEHVFKTASHPQLAPAGGAISAQEIQELAEYAQKFQIELIGNFQAFGHFYHILKHPKYAPLQETPHLISPAVDGSYPLLQDLLTEIADAYPSRYFNVNCDETWGLGTGPAAAMVAEQGVGPVYAKHLNWLHEILAGKHKQMLMWGDIVLQHPESLNWLPKDVIMLAWSYDALDSLEFVIKPFREAGFDAIVCPGVSCWGVLFPNIEKSRVNIHNLIRDGAKHGALGVLNTTWDNGAENLFHYNWYGLAYGADQSWNPGAPDATGFGHRFSAAVYGDTENRVGAAIEGLGALYRLAAMRGLRNEGFWQPVFPQPDAQLILNAGDWDAAFPALEKIEQALAHLKVVQHSDDLAYLQYARDRVHFIGQLKKTAVAASGFYFQASLHQATPDTAGEFLRQAWNGLNQRIGELESLRNRFQQLWVEENRIYWMDRNLKKYDSLLVDLKDVRGNLEMALADFEKGLPLPAPLDLRLNSIALVGDFLTEWRLCGVFPNVQTGPADVRRHENNCSGWDTDFLAEIGGEAAASPQIDPAPIYPEGNPAVWRPIKSAYDIINLREYFTQTEDVVAYAFATIEAPATGGVTFSVGSNDGIKIFLNGKLVHENHLGRAAVADADQVRVQLTAGVNRILLKIDQSGGGWGFCFRLVGASVEPLGNGGYRIK